MLLSAGVTAFILIGLMFYGFWKFQHEDGVDIDHREINPDIPPAQPEMSSADVIEQMGDYVKQTMPINMQAQLPHHTGANQPTAQAAYVPQPQDAQEEKPRAVYQPSDSLTERAAILDEQNPIIATAQHVEADIPDDVPNVSEKYNSSDYGVRHASNSPGRILRRKRYERNAAD